MSRNSSFVLRPFKAPSVSAETASEYWSKLKQAIEKIHRHEGYHMSFEELYRLSYQLVLHKHGDMLYEGVVDTVRAHLVRRAEALRQAPDDLLLGRVKGVWDEHGREMGLVRDILMYMDRTYVTQVPSRLGIWDMGLSLFRASVLRHPGLRGRVTANLLAAFADARALSSPAPASGLLDSGLLGGILAMMVELGCGTLGVYVEEFEGPFLEDAAAALATKSRAFLAAHACPEYLQWAEATLEAEKASAARCAHPTTLPKLAALLERVLVAEHAVALVEQQGSGLACMLERGDGEARANVARMHRLFGLCKAPVLWMDRHGGGSSSSSSSSVSSSSSSSSSSISSVGSGEGGLLASSALPSAPALPGKARQLPPLGIMKESFKAYVLASGRALLSEGGGCKEPTAYVQQLVLLRRRHAEGLVEGSLGGDKDFVRALKEAMEGLLNVPGDTRPPEYLCLFLDDMFRGGFRDKTEAEVEEVMTQVVVLFRFIHNKDEFEERYKSMLQRRLLGGKVISDDYEKLMISKLKTECGFQFTSKLEGMFNDLRVSGEMMERYKAERAARLRVLELEGGAGSGGGSGGGGSSSSAPLSLSHSHSSTSATTAALHAAAALVLAERAASGGHYSEADFTVLTKTNWPTPRFNACTLPRAIAASAEAFRAYYLSIHTGRRLDWYTEKGTADVVFHLSPTQKHELTVSTYQMCALALFNSCGGGGLSFAAITDRCGVPAQELSRHMLSMLVPKYKVLTRSSKGKELLPEEVLCVNTEFASKFFRVRIPLISATSLAPGSGSGAAGEGGRRDVEGDDVQAQVESQRKTMTDAAIVRIMKARKSLDLSSLILEVIKQLSLRFEPSNSDIKKRIEDLIERDYLERDASDSKILSYCA